MVKRVEKEEKEIVEKYILCIYSNIKREWTFQELNDVLMWLYQITQATTCKDAIELAWMEVNTKEEKYRLGAIRDFYLGQFDGKIQPQIDLEKIYEKIVKNGRKKK